MPTHLIQRKTGRAYTFTERLFARGDMVPAMFDGKKIVPIIGAMPETITNVPAATPDPGPVQPVNIQPPPKEPKITEPENPPVGETDQEPEGNDGEITYHIPDDHPMMALKKKEIDEMCAEKFGQALDRTKGKKDMIRDFLAIEMEAEALVGEK